MCYSAPVTNGVATAGPTSISLEDIVGATERMDALINPTTGLGIVGKDHTQDYAYARSRQLPPAELYAMFDESPIFARGLEVIPLEATRNWISIKGTAGEGDEDDFGKVMLKAMDELKLKAKCFEALKAARSDGGCVMILGANDGQDPSEPLELDRIKSLDFINVVTRWEIQPLERDDDPTSPTFREPQFYSFMQGASASEKIHHSRVVRFRGIVSTECPLHRKGGADFAEFWGLPLGQHVKQSLEMFTSGFMNVSAALKNLNEAVFSMNDLREILSGPEGRSRLMTRLEVLRLSQSQYNATVLDGARESYERRASTVMGLEGILVRFSELLAATFGMPLTKLFGTSPGGLSTDDNSGNREWSKIISSAQNDKLLEPLNRIADIMFHAKNGPTNGKVPDDWQIEFNPLDEPDEAAIAATRKVEAETRAIDILNNVVSEAEARTALTNDTTCPYTLDAEYDDAAAEMDAMPAQPELTAAEGEDLAKPKDGKPVVDVQTQMANGIQVTSAIDLVRAIAVGEIEKPSGKQMFISLFRMSPEEAAAIVDPIVVKIPEPEPVMVPAPAATPNMKRFATENDTSSG